MKKEREFDFLKEHGFGVVYGAENVKKKIAELSRLASLVDRP